MGGENFQKDSAFVAGGVRDARRLTELAGLTPAAELLDFGSGAGRLAIGVLEDMGGLRRYVGVDIQPRLVRWCRHHIAVPGFSFVLARAGHERYNPGIGGGKIPIPATGLFDVAHSYSVFSHLRGAEVEWYLGQVYSLVRPGGSVFLTAFVEDDVPAETENPPGYGPFEWSGALHCVRFERSYFEGMVEAAGFDLSYFEHASDTDGQSLYVLGRR